MAFDAGMLASVIHEISSVAGGGRIEKIYQPEKDEIILLAGKGHENYVLDKNGKTAFSERETVQRILNQNRKGIDNVS